MTAARSIAIVAIACRYPDAATPAELWRNVLEGRRSFRAMPAERLPLACYQAGQVPASEEVTPVLAGLITNWQFDRTRFRVPKAAFAATDLAHWLALEVATDAIDAAGGTEMLGSDRTAVIVGNTLTGEFSRANSIRMRLPFLNDVLREALAAGRLDADAQNTLITHFGRVMRERLPAPNEESLAGGLANTIAGRIANHHDLRGGAWAVDGACASALLAVHEACELLTAETIDAAVVGAVDLSLDPFELVGFSRNGALARGEMRVFDRHAEGFWPGEGCGFAVLMRADDAHARGYEALAELAGWGLSTDGRGGLTRPSVEGQQRALTAAYRRAHIAPEELGYVEAHGTGTAIGDAIEIRALAHFVQRRTPALAVGSIKANLGHTKAAAGFAGLIKTVFAVREGVLPPHVGCYEPHPVFAETGSRLAPAGNGAAWPEERARLAGVSAFGFGGINAHVVVRAPGVRRLQGEVRLPARPQDCELLIVSAETRAILAKELRERAANVRRMSLAEMADHAAAATKSPQATCRAAVLASRPDETAELLESVARAAESGQTLLDPSGPAFVADVAAGKAPAIGFLFPGQAAPSRPTAGLWAQRFASAAELVPEMAVDGGTDVLQTEAAQPAIAGAALVGLRLLNAFGVEAQAALGHSLGELAALAWAGVIAEADLIPLARARGATMMRHARGGGSMLRVEAPAAVVLSLIDGLALNVACLNAECETVVSGAADAVPAFAARAAASGIRYAPLPVSHAFHSPDMAQAQEPFARVLNDFAFEHAVRRVISTVTGRPLSPTDDIAALLGSQLTSPVRFTEALAQVGSSCDLLIEVGPGAGLTRLATVAGYLACSIDAHGWSLRSLCGAVGLAWTLGAAVDFGPLFADRPLRPLPMHRPMLLTNPCGQSRPAPAPARLDTPSPTAATEDHDGAGHRPLARHENACTTLDRVRAIVAQECGLPAEAITAEARLLDDLHLNSLRVGRIVTQLTRDVGAPPMLVLTEFANASLAELASTVDEVAAFAPEQKAPEGRIDGVAPWIARYGVDWLPADPPDDHEPAMAWRIGDRRFAPAPEARPALTISAQGTGVLFWLDEHVDDDQLPTLWAPCQRAAADETLRGLAIVHVGLPLSAFARSLLYERRFERIVLLDLRAGDSPIVRDRVSSLLAAPPVGLTERMIDTDGSLSRPVLRPLASMLSPTRHPLTRRDVILCTGGARGIGSECALRLAQTTGARLLVIGRSERHHAEVAQTLARAEASGLCVHYVQADVTAADQVSRAVREGTALLGPVTGILHAAGINEPARFTEIDLDQLHRTIAPKVDGLRHCLEAVNLDDLRLLVTFGSIIGRMGLSGETHYALANALQTSLVERLAAARPQLQAVALEWSIWASGGMGERHGSLERLAAQGVDALPMAEAVVEFERIVVGRDAPPRAAIVVTSRFGPPARLDLGAQPLPLFRFLEDARVSFPGIELIVDAEISLGTDPYLGDHRVDGIAVLPGVVALEAMAQAACALASDAVLQCATDIEFARAITVPDAARVTLRTAALRDQDGTVRTVVRSSDDDFASIRCRARWTASQHAECHIPTAMAASPGAIDAAGFYGPLFFHGATFQRIERYERLTARRLKFQLRPEGQSRWFGEYLPQARVTGDVGAHDALLHGLQASVPHRRVLPEGVGRIRLLAREAEIAVVEARERESTTDRFVFDIVARNADGVAVEIWEAAAFRAIGPIEGDRQDPALGLCYLERQLGDLLARKDLRLALAVGSDRRDRRRAAFAELGYREPRSRSDGAPLLCGIDDVSTSLAHTANATLAVAAPEAVACDLEPLQPETDAPLLPADRSLAQAIADVVGEPLERAVLRVWGARECLRKLGVHHDCRLSLAQCSEGAAVVLSGAGASIASMPSASQMISVSCADTDRILASLPGTLAVHGGTAELSPAHLMSCGGAG